MSDYQSGTTAAPSTARRVLASVAQFVGFQPFVTASLTTALSGANNDLLYTAKQRGTAGNSVSVAYVVSGNSTPLSVSVTGSAITVNVATDSGGAPTSTAAQVAAAVQASAPANTLVTVSNAIGNDGTGVVAALGTTPLASGVDAPVGTSGSAKLPTQPPIHARYN